MNAFKTMNAFDRKTSKQFDMNTCTYKEFIALMASQRTSHRTKFYVPLDRTRDILSICYLPNKFNDVF